MKKTNFFSIITSIIFVFLAVNFFSNVAMAAPQTLTILGAQGTPGQTDPYTQYSQDNGQTWHQAYLYGSHPWGLIPGTNSWINCGPSGTDYCINQTVLYRIRFNVPEGSINPQMTFDVNADNYATILLNGTYVAKVVGAPNRTSINASVNSKVQTGMNEIRLLLTDEGGWAGLNYKITLNVDAPTPPTLNTDNIAPTTTDNAPVNWVNQDVTVNLTATDNANGSGVAATYYSLDNGVQQTGTTVSVTGEGQHPLTYWSVDKAGNVESKHMVTINIDKTAPTTADNAPAGWVNKDVTVNLSANDGGSGVAVTKYSVDGGVQQTGTSVVLTAEGIHTITYWSLDNAGNIEAQHTATIKIDKTAPVSSAIVSPATPNGSNGWYTSNVTLSLSAQDSLSGVTKTVYQVNYGVWTTYNGTIPAFDDGVYKVSYRSTDNAGNVEEIKTVEFKVDKTAPVLVVQLDKTVIAPLNDEKMAVIHAALNASDATSGVASVILTSITGYKMEKDQGEQNQYPKKVDFLAELGTSATSFSLLAEEGYIYTITYTITDNAGNKSTVVSTVSVIETKVDEDGHKGKDSSKKGE